MFEYIELNAIQEENARELVKRLLNMVEQLSREVRELRVENQGLRDEVNRLKGEQGKLDIKGEKVSSPKADHSSETEQHKKRVRHKKSKKVEVQIDRKEILKVDAQQLPADAEYKGYETVVVQDIQIKTESHCGVLEGYYQGWANLRA
jgi:chromosome segregation ATPase